jgi:hypothetical protein
MIEVMTRWARLLLATAAMTLAGSGAPVVERMMSGHATAVQTAVGGVDNVPDAVVATRARAPIATAALRLVPIAVAASTPPGDGPTVPRGTPRPMSNASPISGATPPSWWTRMWSTTPSAPPRGSRCTSINTTPA